MSSGPARLTRGTRLPTLDVQTLEGGDRLTLPDDLHGLWSVLLFYRGHW